jgi:hypothetical protein
VYPVYLPGFFFVSWIRKFTSIAHSCAYTRPCRTDPQVLPSWYFRPRHSSFWSRWRGLRIIILSWALFGCFNTWKLRVVFFQLVANPSRWEWISESYYLLFITSMMKSIVHSYGEADISIFIGCATSTTDGSSPRGYSRIFSSVGSEVYSSFSFSFVITSIK